MDFHVRAAIARAGTRCRFHSERKGNRDTAPHARLSERSACEPPLECALVTINPLVPRTFLAFKHQPVIVGCTLLVRRTFSTASIVSVTGEIRSHSTIKPVGPNEHLRLLETLLSNMGGTGCRRIFSCQSQKAQSAQQATVRLADTVARSLSRVCFWRRGSAFQLNKLRRLRVKRREPRLRMRRFSPVTKDRM